MPDIGQNWVFGTRAQVGPVWVPLFSSTLRYIVAFGWPSWPIRILRYILTCTRIRAMLPSTILYRLCRKVTIYRCLLMTISTNPKLVREHGLSLPIRAIPTNPNATIYISLLEQAYIRAIFLNIMYRYRLSSSGLCLMENCRTKIDYEFSI